MARKSGLRMSFSIWAGFKCCAGLRFAPWSRLLSGPVPLSGPIPLSLLVEKLRLLSEIFVGEAGKCAAQLAGASQYVQESFKTMRYIVTVGWCIYPLGYLFGYLLGSVDSASLNLLYNLADLVNKIAFVCAVWNSAKNETLSRKGGGW